jgi:serine/threonine protein kinase
MESITDTPSKLGSHGENLVEKKFVMREDAETQSGKHAEVIFVQTPMRRNQFAVKRQVIRSPTNEKDKAYRELRIFNELSKLNCENFVSMVDWFKIRAPLFDDEKSESEEQQYMHFIMEYAENTLWGMRTQLDIFEFRSILFQLLFALYTAQKRLEFNHNDLHIRNILLKSQKTGEQTRHHDKDLNSTWFTNSYTVKICDFGLSR